MMMMMWGFMSSDVGLTAWGEVVALLLLYVHGGEMAY